MNKVGYMGIVESMHANNVLMYLYRSGVAGPDVDGMCIRKDWGLIQEELEILVELFSGQRRYSIRL